MKVNRIKASGTTAPLSAAALNGYASALSQYLVKRVRRPEDIPDLTQQIFELFFRRKDQSETIRNPLAYLFRIAFHVIGDAMASERKVPVTFDSALLADDVTGKKLQSSDQVAEELAVQEDVLAALKTLPVHYLRALMLVDGQGLSYKEAALVSGYTPNTIATYVMHGRAALKLALDDH